MYRLSTRSTSTTDILAASRAEIAFSPMAIMSGIHRTLIDKSYSRMPNMSSSALEDLGERILERVQREVSLVLLETGFDHRTDWESRVFRPIIATFNIVEELGVSREDSEYIFLLVTALSLAFELLLLAGRDKARKARTFLVRAFDDIFVEPEICRKVGDVLDAERARLIRINAGMEVLRAIQGVRMLIPDTTTCTAAWNARMLHSLRGNDSAYYLRHRVRVSALLDSEPRISMCTEEAANKFLREAETFEPLQRFAINPFHVKMKIFLRYGCCWLFDFVTSMDLDRKRARMSTSKGLSIELEAGCSVSPVAAFHNKMSVTMPAGSINGFTGTIYIPPGCSYRVDRVREVRKKTSDMDWTLIETVDGVLEISEGNYAIKHVNVGTRVIVENVR